MEARREEAVVPARGSGVLDVAAGALGTGRGFRTRARNGPKGLCGQAAPSLWY